jgi:hypothetical protein
MNVIAGLDKAKVTQILSPISMQVLRTEFSRQEESEKR